MKNFPILCFLLFCVQFSSCSTDETINRALFDEQKNDPTASNPDDTTVGGTNDDTVEEEEVIITATETCFIQDIEFLTGEPTKIDCLLDLEGGIVNVPENVILEFDGGDIFNGTLNFSSLGKIDGKLLNSNLVVEGDVVLLSEEFVFYVDRWDIVEGETTSDIALSNNKKLEGLFDMVKNLNGNTFIIDELDAYFEVTRVTSTTSDQNFRATVESVNIPSNFSLIMSDETILRVFPTEGDITATLLGIREAENILVKGGTLYGDRDLRTYLEENEETGAHLLSIRSGNNIVLDGITFEMGSHGGLNINSQGFSFNPDYDPTHDVTVQNCTFNKIRRTALVLTDGNNIIIDNNEFNDTGQPTANSDGGVVKFAINMEPIRQRDESTGELIEFQKVHDVVVKNNKERGSANGGFLVFIGQRIRFENNDMENSISYTFGSNVEIHNNTFLASTVSGTKPAITTGGSGETVFDNSISGNIITGYSIGIAASYKDVEVYGNQINECNIGIQLKNAFDINIQNNDITSSLSSSRGIQGHITDLNNINIYENEVSVLRNPFYFVQVNKEEEQEDYEIDIYENKSTTSAKSFFSDSNGINFKDNIHEGGLELANTWDINLLNNTISTIDSDGIDLRGLNNNIKIIENNITHLAGFECIDVSDDTNINEIEQSLNDCMEN